MTTTDYDPLTGTNWDQAAATAAWSASMNRSKPRWNLRGPLSQPRKWYWSFFNFGTWTGRVTIEADGFHWAVRSYDSGDLLRDGVTTSVFEAFQSVEQNKDVAAPAPDL